jgi:hypothetical protein
MRRAGAPYSRAMTPPRTIRRVLRTLALAVLLLASAAVPAFAGPDGDKPAAPAEVHVGIYVNRITEVSLKSNHFDVDFWIWFRWLGDTLSPLDTFDLVGGSIQSRSGEVKGESKEFHYAAVRVNAEVTQFFDVTRFPFDDHTLRIAIEDTKAEAHALVYVPDVANSGVAPDVQVPGWAVSAAAAEVAPHGYATNYGDISLPTGDASQYSRFVLPVELRRSGAGYFAKLFFGLFIAVGIALLALHIKPTDLDPRFGLPVGAIFAAVGSLYVTSSILPDTNTMTLSDRLHILAFVTIFLTLVESTIALKLWGAGNEEGAKKLDRVCFRAFAILFLGGAAIAVAVS